MSLTNFLVNQVLSDYFTSNGTQYLALHITDPTNSGLATTELSTTSMATYTRKQVTWSTPVNRAVTNTNLIQWQAMPAVNIGFLAVWDAPTGGHLLATMPVADPFEIATAGATIYLPIGSIAVTIGSAIPGYLMPDPASLDGVIPATTPPDTTTPPPATP